MNNILLDDIIANKAKDEAIRMSDEATERLISRINQLDIQSIKKKRIKKNSITAALLALVLLSSIWFGSGYAKLGLLFIGDKLDYLAEYKSANGKGAVDKTKDENEKKVEEEIDDPSFVTRTIKQVKRELDKDNIESAVYVEGLSGVIVSELNYNGIDYKLRIYLSEKDGKNLYEIYMDAFEPYKEGAIFVLHDLPILKKILPLFEGGISAYNGASKFIAQDSIEGYTSTSNGGSGGYSCYDVRVTRDEPSNILNLALANGIPEINIGDLPEELLENRVEWFNFASYKETK